MMTMAKRETLADEFARLVVEYHAGGPAAAEAWNHIADFATANADTIYKALDRVPLNGENATAAKEGRDG